MHSCPVQAYYRLVFLCMSLNSFFQLHFLLCMSVLFLKSKLLLLPPPLPFALLAAGICRLEPAYPTLANWNAASESHA